MAQGRVGDVIAREVTVRDVAGREVAAREAIPGGDLREGGISGVLSKVFSDEAGESRIGLDMAN
ncbi:hypothetical protein HEK616_29070 [Streptomyces nigrescens]|uniref:Uncharacterized protein n=2 Tax=Streptomyces TaxID=1883 RepID=A0ABM7ZSQ5_STRNI|nr:hypothetical protein [Streptomyces nigrescens]MEE4418235.1 hypothetical protein [Streptomyces sp. DSM 41528]BDM69420.1 hypothetical protein HEK616_29070 [Streptomyces nigrescens]